MQNEITEEVPHVVKGGGFNHAGGGFGKIIIDGVDYDAQSVASTFLAALAAAEAQPVAWTQQSQLDGIADDETYNGGMWAKRDCQNVRDLMDMQDMPDDVPLYASQPVASTADGWVMVRDGWVVVPREPTEYMLEAADYAKPLPESFIRIVYSAMITNAPAIAMLAARPTPSVDTEARRMALEEAAKIIEAHIIQDTSAGKVLRPRQDGNVEGLAYSAAIRALIPQEGKADA